MYNKSICFTHTKFKRKTENITKVRVKAGQTNVDIIKKFQEKHCKFVFIILLMSAPWFQLLHPPYEKC